MTAHGHFYTHTKHAAEHLRFALYDYLKHPTFDVEDLGDPIEFRGSKWSEYRIYFDNVPNQLYDQLAALYVGENAVYPYLVGVCAYMKKEPQ